MAHEIGQKVGHAELPGEPSAGSGAWNRTTIQGFKELREVAQSYATTENKGVRDARTSGSEQDDPPEGEQVGRARDVVERALAEALMLAAQAGQWDVVRRLAGESEARRRASS
ncbi:MAG: hypothetical protein FJ104_01760 [Deltaproteobacteria bacterium]|nr:hypothetical protein [Deltaproteobacteria bacterium]